VALCAREDQAAAHGIWIPVQQEFTWEVTRAGVCWYTPIERLSLMGVQVLI